MDDDSRFTNFEEADRASFAKLTELVEKMKEPASEKVNLRCPTCQQMRRAVISPMFPDHLVVICDHCLERDEQERLRNFRMFKDGESDPRGVSVLRGLYPKWAKP